MNKVYYSRFIVLVVILLTTAISCREAFDSEFREVPIVNQPPEVTTPIDDIVISPGFGVLEIDLSIFITDQEGNPVSYVISSSDESVVTVSVSGSLLSITEVSEGTSTISIEATDGNAGNEVSTSFVITIEPILGADDPSQSYQFLIDFNGVANGTAMLDMTLTGATHDAFGADGFNMEVDNNHLKWTDYEWSGMEIVFDTPLDLTANSVLRFDYFDVWQNEDEFYGILMFEDELGNFSEEIWLGDFDYTFNEPQWNTFDNQLFLSDFVENPDEGWSVDISKIKSIYFEKFGGGENPPQQWRIDNIAIGEL